MRALDQLAKRVGKGALEASGVTVVQDEIVRDAQHADLRHEPDPARGAERARLGLLGRLASVLCLIEVFGHAPSGEEIRDCVGKHIAFWAQRAAEAQKKGVALVEPFLWIIAAGRPSHALEALRCPRGVDWPEGVYFFGEDVMRTGIVVASELPRERSTLLVRLMAGGPGLPKAIRDLAALPRDAHERDVAEQILLNLQHALIKKQGHTPAEQEFVVTMYRGWEDARQDGRVEQARDAVRRVLARRSLTLSAADQGRIDGCTDLATLDQWLDQAIEARTAAEALKGTARRRRVAHAV